MDGIGIPPSGNPFSMDENLARAREEMAGPRPSGGGCGAAVDLLETPELLKTGEEGAE
jgi:hypothetical protein